MIREEHHSDKMKLIHPFSAIIAGSSGTGKTVFTRGLLEDYKSVTTITSPKLKVWWCHGQEQPLHAQDVPGVDIVYFNEFVSDFSEDKPDIIIYDDLMSEIAGRKELTDVFTKKRHHENVSVIFVLQNLFFQSKEMRTISLNCMYFILMKNPRDRMQLMALGRQIFPSQQGYFTRVVEDAFKEPFSHLVIDMTSQCNESHRLRQRVKEDGKSGWFIWSK